MYCKATRHTLSSPFPLLFCYSGYSLGRKRPKSRDGLVLDIEWRRFDLGTNRVVLCILTRKKTYRQGIITAVREYCLPFGVRELYSVSYVLIVNWSCVAQVGGIPTSTIQQNRPACPTTKNRPGQNSLRPRMLRPRSTTAINSSRDIEHLPLCGA